MPRVNVFGSSISPWHLVIDACISVIALYISLAVRLGGEDTMGYFAVLQNFLPIFVAVRVLTFYLFGLYKSIWRYSSLFDLSVLLRAVALSELLFFTVSYLLPDFGRLPRSIFFIDFFISMALLGGIRLFSRIYREREGLVAKSKNRAGSQLIVIYGAGENGRFLAQRLMNDKKSDQVIVGFVDDDASKLGKIIVGLPVLGTGSNLSQIIETKNITGVMVSINNASGELIRKIVEQTRQHNIMPQIFHHFHARKAGQENILREVSLQDLLSRKPAEIDFSSIRNVVTGKIVLVTGAGGSIGSELARQILKFQPKKLLLADHSEFNLYNIDSELRISASAQNDIVPLLIDIKDKNALSHVFETYKPQVVYHAAAYKHVHLVEVNPHAAILNNVYGTFNLLELSDKFGVERFLNVSTDKAVNPVGVMGCTKRVCELLVSQWGDKTLKSYSSVRFGNVLGSSGSLIPMLQAQILAGGPLTITHPDMQRYFMLIPEAVSLVLMSSVISKPGDICLLKMGEQVKILDLAKSLIALSGKSEDEIKIIFTGLRPGEKMYEELYICGNEIQTSHEDILTIPRGDNAGGSSKADLVPKVVELIEYAQLKDDKAVQILRDLASNN